MSDLFLGCLCRCARVLRFPYDAHLALDLRGDHYHERGDLYIGTIAPHLEMIHAHGPDS
jgi:hypothetical protein